ncbi:unnamed protein product, partial [Trichogramma brassicae]
MEGSQTNSLYSNIFVDCPTHLQGEQSRAWTGHEDEAAGEQRTASAEQNGVRGIEAEKI